MGRKPTAAEWSARMARKRVFEQATDEEKVAMLLEDKERLANELREVKHSLSVERQRNKRIDRRSTGGGSTRNFGRRRIEPVWADLVEFMDQEDRDIVDDLVARLKMRVRVARGEKL